MEVPQPVAPQPVSMPEELGATDQTFALEAVQGSHRPFEPLGRELQVVHRQAGHEAVVCVVGQCGKPVEAAAIVLFQPGAEA